LNFVRKLFEMEVAEIADGTVTLAAMAREPGYRTKVCVKSTDPKVDPVGACVGARGARVKSIVREMNGEKVDIVRWFEDPIEQLAEALKPASPQNVTLDREKRRMYFEVVEDDLSVAIGRKASMLVLHPDFLAGSWILVKLLLSRLVLMSEKAKLRKLLPLSELNLKSLTGLLLLDL
jgi:transcription antitermination factor NusA-like protein